MGGFNPQYREGPDHDYLQYNHENNPMAHWPFGRGSSRQTVSEARVDGRQGRGSSPRSRSLQVKSHHKDATGMEGMAVEGEGQGQAWGTLAPGGIRMAEGIWRGGIQLGRFW